MGELIRALGALADPPEPGHAVIARALDLPDPAPGAVHTELFLFQLYPYASVYVGPEGMLGGVGRDRVAGFWRAMGEDPPNEPDHIATLLGLYAAVCDAEASATAGPRRVLWRESRKALLWEHLLCWMVAYAHAVSATGAPFYAEWARLLRSALLSEASSLGGPDDLPLHLREAPSLSDPRESGGGEFLAELLAPVRSGLILTRSDLGRCSRDIGLGLRSGERKYILESLLSQNSASTLGWLGDEAVRHAARLESSVTALGPVGRFWVDRALATSRLLHELSRAADGGEGGEDGAPMAERGATEGQG